MLDMLAGRAPRGVANSAWRLRLLRKGVGNALAGYSQSLRQTKVRVLFETSDVAVIGVAETSALSRLPG